MPKFTTNVPLGTIVWTPLDGGPGSGVPQDKKTYLVTGPSGYGKRPFLTTARVDEEFRPAKGGQLRWLDPTDTELTDAGWVPHYFAEMIEIPDYPGLGTGGDDE